MVSPIHETRETTVTITYNCTVKSHFTDTHVIQTPHYYSQFALSLGKESPYIFSKKFNPLHTDTYYGPLGDVLG